MYSTDSACYLPSAGCFPRGLVEPCGVQQTCPLWGGILPSRGVWIFFALISFRVEHIGPEVSGLFTSRGPSARAGCLGRRLSARIWAQIGRAFARILAHAVSRGVSFRSCFEEPDWSRQSWPCFLRSSGLSKGHSIRRPSWLKLAFLPSCRPLFHSN